MKGLLFAILFAFGFAYFATQNNTTVTIRIAQYVLYNTPLYLIILTGILVGILFAMVVNFFASVSSFLIIQERENTIKEMKRTIAELIKRVHILEMKEEDKEDLNQEQTYEQNIL